jgi:hypothetical protein
MTPTKTESRKKSKKTQKMIDVQVKKTSDAKMMRGEWNNDKERKTN